MRSPWNIPWLTLVMHFSLSAIATFIVGQFEESGLRAASYPIVYYTAREIEQLLKKVWARFVAKDASVVFRWLDQGADVATAVAGALLVTFTLL